MQIGQFSVQVERNIFLEVSPICYQFRLSFFSMCRLPPLFLSTIDPAAGNIENIFRTWNMRTRKFWTEFVTLRFV
jgi:hypothetical protein